MDDQRVADYFIVAGLEKNAAPLKITDESEAFVRKDIKDPITDLAVIDRTLDEPVPDGYSCVESTPTGYVADLNFGSFRCHSLFLCYRRGRDKPPLVHIGVHFEGKGLGHNPALFHRGLWHGYECSVGTVRTEHPSENAFRR